MNITLGTAFALAAMVVAACSTQGSAQQPASAAAAKHESPFACDRLALTPEQRKRHFDELGPALKSLKTGIRELPDGYEFTFPSDMKTYQLVTEWAAGERVCCPFFDIDLNSEAEGGRLTMRLTGRAGTKQFIESDFGKWLKLPL